jgi:Xaa-Pro aminopeptidase
MMTESTNVEWYRGATRQARIQDALQRNRLDVLLALTAENAAYLSGRTSTIATLWGIPGLIAVATNTRGQLAVAAGDNEIGAYTEVTARFVHPLWIEHLDLRGEGDLVSRVREARPEGVLARPAQFAPDRLLEAVAAATRANLADGSRVGTELSVLPEWLIGGLRRLLPEVELVDANTIFADLRAIKDPDEITHLRLAAELTEMGIAGARDALRPGLNAVAVSASYQIAIWDRAAGDARFAALRQVEGLVAVGDGSATGDVGPGQTVKLDMQVDVGGYHSDIGRTYALQPTPDQLEVFAALRSALARVVETLAPGVPLRDVWRAGIESMRQSGFVNYSRGHLGHSVGLAHNYEEPPFIAADDPRPLAPGMVISVELPYYLRGVGSFQLERMALIGESGIELLDKLPLALQPG